MMYVTKDTLIRIIASELDEHTRYVTAESICEAGRLVSTYDWFGNRCYLRAEETNKDSLAKLTATTGEPVFVGRAHQLLCRKHGKASYARVEVGDINEPVYVHLPQRKVALDNDSLFTALDADNDSVFLKTTSHLNLVPLMHTAAAAGITVHRKQDALRIDLERGRPICFAMKVINGNFQENMIAAYEELTSKAIVQPCHRFDEAMDRTERSGIIFEGASLYNEALVFPPEFLDRDAKLYKITCQERTPIELAWWCT